MLVRCSVRTRIESTEQYDSSTYQPLRTRGMTVDSIVCQLRVPSSRWSSAVVVDIPIASVFALGAEMQCRRVILTERSASYSDRQWSLPYADAKCRTGVSRLGAAARGSVAERGALHQLRRRFPLSLQLPLWPAHTGLHETGTKPQAAAVCYQLQRLRGVAVSRGRLFRDPHTRPAPSADRPDAGCAAWDELRKKAIFRRLQSSQKSTPVDTRPASLD